jgi:hypothetical protein
VSKPPGSRRNVQRVDHHHFHGWQVCLKRAGERHEHYFGDEGDRQAALRRALRWRDQMAAVLPPSRKFQRRHVLNTTGVVGVHFSRQYTRARRLANYYGATWVDELGQRHKRSFSVAKYGTRKARALAVDARTRALALLLRPASRHSSAPIVASKNGATRVAVAQARRRTPARARSRSLAKLRAQ